MDIKRVVKFCKAHDCDNCPLLDDEMGATYNCGLGLFTDQPEIAEDMIVTWEKEEEKRKIEKRQIVYIICDVYIPEQIYGVASSNATAIKMKGELERIALKDILAVDPEDSGIYWDKMTEEQKTEFYNTQIKSSFVIKEMKLDCYICDEGVRTI